MNLWIVILYNLFLFLNYVYARLLDLYTNMSVGAYVDWKEGIESPGVQVIGHCDLSYVIAGHWIWVLWGSSTYF